MEMDQSHFRLHVQAEAIPVPGAHNPVRVLVTGSRDYGDRDAVSAVLWGISETHGPLHVTDGACPPNKRGNSLDYIAHRFALSQGWGTYRMAAKWQDPCRPECNHGARRWRRGDNLGKAGYFYCPAQGNWRNQGMVDQGHDVCIGWPTTPRSPGTLDCMTRAYQAGIPTYVVMHHEADLMHTDAFWSVRRFLR